jgi:glutaconate CoA-transferase subunit A
MSQTGPHKLCSLSELAARIPDGASVSFGGVFLHRGPFALVRELVRQGRRDLEIIKTAPAYDLDLLCRAKAVAKVRAGIIAMEGNFGLAPWSRRAIERKEVVLQEHACPTLVAGLRAARYGLPFQPVAGVHGSDLAALNGWQTVKDPYGSGKEVYVIPAIQPDVAVIHVHEIDALGNARVFGSPFWDHAITRASKRVLVTAEKLVSTDVLRAQPEMTLLPGFMVEAAAIVPRGAWPGSMAKIYDIDYAGVENYLVDAPGALEAHLAAAPETETECTA